MDATGGERRDDAGGVADEQDAVARKPGDATADGDPSTAPRDAPRAAPVEQRRELALECGKIRLVRPARGKPDLRHAVDTGDDPADVARRKLGIEEAVQAIRIDSAYVFVFGFDAEQEGAIARQAEGARDAGMRAVRPDQIADARTDPGEHHGAGVAASAAKRTVVAQSRAGAACLLREPLHQRGRV